MKFGIALPIQGRVSGVKAIIDTANRVEKLGLDSAWVYDVPLNRESYQSYSVCGSIDGISPNKDPDIYEPLTTLSYLAGTTNSIKLGTCVLRLPDYNPIVLAKQAANMDVISGGRLIFGVAIGAIGESGRSESEARSIPYAQRGSIFDEYIAAVREIWSKPKSSFHGRYVNFSDLEIYPKPVNPKIYVGTGLSEKGIRRVAKYGDGWLPSHTLTPDEIEGGIKRIRDEAKALGRSGFSGFDVIPRTYLCIGSSREEAWNVASNTLQSRLRKLSGAVGSRELEFKQKLGLPKNYTEESRALIGTEADVVNGIEKYRKAGIDHLGFYCIFTGGVDNLFELIETLARNIIPSFR